MITNVEKVTIKNAIMHVLNSEDSELILSNIELPLDDDEFIDFLSGHIRKSVRSKNRIIAKFLEPNTNYVKKRSEAILNDRNTFIESSKQIASYLFTAMKSNSSIKSSDLIVCIYENNDNEEFLAILMLEYQKNFFHEKITLPDGTIGIKYKKDLLSFPSTSANLKKCAFIQKYKKENEFDLLLLERGISRASEKVAQFFKDNFLFVEFTMDDTKKTSLFLLQTTAWTNVVLNNTKLNREEMELLDNVKSKCVDYLNEKDNIDIDNFITEVIPSEDMQKEYRQFIESKGLIDLQFNVDKVYVECIRYRKIKTSSGIEIKVPLEVYDNEECFTKLPLGEGNFDIKIPNIKIQEEKVCDR